MLCALTQNIKLLFEENVDIIKIVERNKTDTILVNRIIPESSISNNSCRLYNGRNRWFFCLTAFKLL